MCGLYSQLVNGAEYPVLLLNDDSVFYASGFRTTAKTGVQIGKVAVWMEPDNMYLIAPENWENQIYECGLKNDCKLFLYKDNDSFYSSITNFIKNGGYSSIYSEYKAVTREFTANITEVNILDITRSLMTVRLIKTEEEIELIRQAANVAMLGMETVRKAARPGVRELDIVAEVEYCMRKNGSSGVPFTMKALSGNRGSILTEVPNNSVVNKDDLLLMDVGATVDGYSADWARTFCVGKPNEDKNELYDFVFGLERSCIEMLKPGIHVNLLTDNIKKLCGENRFGKYVKPHLGHSIGILSQEWPNINPQTDLVLKENMVITIEPGAYVPGIGGMRIEDEIIITADGYEIITGLKKESLEIEL